MEELEALRRNIVTILNGLRFSMERSVDLRLPGDMERQTRALLLIEEARIRFNFRTRQHVRPLLAEEFQEARRELILFVEEFARSEALVTLPFTRRFRLPVPSRQIELNPTFLALNGTPLSEALILIRNYLAKLEIVTPAQTELSFNSLEKIVPGQQVAPVHFDVVDNRIVIADRSPNTKRADRRNIEAALGHIRDSGDRLISNLENSNCDKRLLESVKHLQAQMVSNGNIVKIGLSNMACTTMGAQFQSEMPEAVVAMFNSYNTSVSIYVAQFPEWEQFTAKAASIELDSEDIAQVEEAADSIITALSRDPKLADPEVPKTIAFIRQVTQLPGTTSKRAAFAMIRTIENLVSSILRHSLVLVGKTADKLTDKGSTVAANAIMGLLGVALLSAVGIGPAAAHVGAAWVQQVAVIVKKQIDTMMQ